MWGAWFPTPLLSKMLRNMSENANREDDARESGSPTRYPNKRNFTLVPIRRTGRPRACACKVEFQRVACDPYAFQATPLRGRRCPGQNAPGSNNRSRGTMSLRTWVKLSAGISVPGGPSAFSKSPSPKARRMLRKCRTRYLGDHLLCLKVCE